MSTCTFSKTLLSVCFEAGNSINRLYCKSLQTTGKCVSHFAIFGHFLDEDDTICVIFYILSYNLSSEKVDE